MTIGMIIWLFVLSIYTNVVSSLGIYNGDKKRYQQNAHGKMLEAKMFRFFLKFDRDTTQIYLKTMIANLLLFGNVILEIVLFILALVTSNETFKIISGSGTVVFGLAFCAVITAICKNKIKK